LELLLRSGLSAAPALGAARKTVDNSWARAQLDTAFQNVRTGRSAAREIAQLGILPPLSNALLMAAEDAGALKEGAERLAILYEEELDRRIKILMRIAEPVFVGLTGLAVGTIMLTLVSALISVNEAIAQ
jgi:type II secretory pathway component PulF